MRKRLYTRSADFTQPSSGSYARGGIGNALGRIRGQSSKESTAPGPVQAVVNLVDRTILPHSPPAKGSVAPDTTASKVETSSGGTTDKSTVTSSRKPRTGASTISAIQVSNQSPSKGTGGETTTKTSSTLNAPAPVSDSSGSESPQGVTISSGSTDPQIPNPEVITGSLYTGSGYSQTPIGASKESNNNTTPVNRSFGLPVGLALGITALLLLLLYIYRRKQQKVITKGKDLDQDNFMVKRPIESIKTIDFSVTPTRVKTTSTNIQNIVEAFGNQFTSKALPTPPVDEPPLPPEKNGSPLKNEYLPETPRNSVEVPVSAKSERESLNWFGPSSKLLRSVYTKSMLQNGKRMTDVSLSESLME